MTPLRPLLLLTMAVALSGCASFASVAVETIDAKVSMMRDERCHLAHLMFGRSYCETKRIEKPEEARHCVKTLGDMDCYAALPDPNGRSTRAAAPPPARTMPAEADPDLRPSPALPPTLAQR